MAEPKSLARALFRLAVLLVVAGSLLVGIPLRPSGAAPDTVVRTVIVPARALLPTAPGPAIVASGNGILAVAEAETATARVCAPVWSTGLGVTFRQASGAPVHVGVAAERVDGTARPVVHLDAEDDADPDSHEYDARRGSTFLWTGGSRCARLTLELPAGARIADVRVVFVNTSGTAGGPGTGPPNLGPVVAGEPGGIDPAQALARKPRIVTREQWGADPKLMNCTPSVADEVRMGFVHHTAGSNAYSRAEADDVIRGVYAYHTNGRGWCDVGYNFLVDRYGTIYEGRSGGVEVPVIGAAQMGFNTRAFSVSVMGNFEVAPVPTAAQAALVRLIAWRLDVAHVNPIARATMTSAGGDNTRYELGEVVRLRTISGHRDTGYTACPGARLYELLPRLRALVAQRGLPKIYAPRLSKTELTVGTPANVRVRAKASRSLRWSVDVLAPDGTVYAGLGESTGDVLDLLWARAGPPAQPTAPGVYTVVISGSAPDGSLAREAALPLALLPEPSPSPTPSPTPSTTPSPSPTTTP